ncbi:MAG: rod shape-determining protein MreC [Saprospiraceae bacterium]
MQDLLAFFLRFGGVFTFVVLEAICALLIVRYNDSHRAIWLHSGNQISGSIAEKVDAWTDFVSLREVADSLAAENARLRLQILLQPEGVPDSVQMAHVDSSFILIPTRVVRNSVAMANNTLTIDRGTVDGVSAREGVISGRSIIGVTRSVGQEYSEVLSLLHSESQISATLVKAGYYGVLRWEGIEPRKMTLEEIPRHARLSVGDSVVTSGFSAIFPKGLHIGRVDTFWLKPGSDFYDVRVALSHDPANLDYGYIVKRDADSARILFEEQTSNVQ